MCERDYVGFERRLDILCLLGFHRWHYWEGKGINCRYCTGCKRLQQGIEGKYQEISKGI